MTAHNASSAALLAALLAGPGCGLDDLGVLSVHVTLASTEPTELPAALDPLDPETLHGASGEVDADVPEQTVRVDTIELPDPPEGYGYLVVLSFAHSPIDGLADAAAHNSNSTHQDEGGHDEGEPLADVVVGRLQPVADEAFSGAFGAADIGGEQLGALRGVAVLLAPDGAATGEGAVTVLAGQADLTVTNAELPAGEGAGHSHGA